MIERIVHEDRELALIVRRSFSDTGISFLTPPESDLQLGYMNRESGYEIEPHMHLRTRREIFSTQEVLIIKRGRVRANFYGGERTFVDSRVLEAGDILVLIAGGHGFEILESAEIFEVKQGPYVGNRDKERFSK